MTPFARYFKLKDPERTDFRLSTGNPEHVGLYVDLDKVIPRLRTELQSEAPKFLLQGDFGTGKSHVLRYVEKILAHPQFKPVYILLSGFHRRSDFFQVHQQLAAELLPLAKEALLSSGDKSGLVDRLPGITENMRKALKDLAIPGIGAPRSPSVTAEQWLSGSRGLTSSRMSDAGYTRHLQEEAGPDRLVGLYKAISDLFSTVYKKRILILMDEAESFTRIVDTDAQASIGAAMRAFFDGENQSLGFFLGLNSPRARHAAHPMLRSDVQSRVGARQIELRPLSVPERVASFIETLWPGLTKGPERLPFLLGRTSRELIHKQLPDLIRLASSDDMSTSPAPRQLLNLLSSIGQLAVEQKVNPPIEASVIRSWFGPPGV